MTKDVFKVLKEWGIKDYKKIDRKTITEMNLGAAILATGGGGDPEIGLLWAYRALDEGKDIVMIDPMDIPDDILVASPHAVGAPVVLTERPPSYDVINKTIRKLERYLGRDLDAIIPFECGGVNSTVAYAAAGELGVPVIDVDGMNRAFPEIQMTSWAAQDVNAAPAASGDERGHVTIVDTIKDNVLTERIARRAAMSYGGNSWLVSYPMNGKQVKETSILNSQSIALELGRAVFNAREKHLNPVEEMLKSLKDLRNVEGVKVFKGKIVDIIRKFGSETTTGFSSGSIIMEGLDEYKGSSAEIDFQNEWLTLKVDNELKCLPPDLIIIVDSETGEPIRTDIMKYGYRGTIVLIPAHERMRTKKAIELCGPKYFGYDTDYVPVEELNKDK